MNKLVIAHLWIFIQITVPIPSEGWLSGNAFVSGAVGLRFKSRAVQVEHSVANDSSLQRHFSKEAVLPGRNDAEVGPANSLHASA